METSESNGQVGTTLILGTQVTPYKLNRKLHNHELPMTRFQDHVVITKLRINRKYRGLAYPYVFQWMYSVPKMLREVVSACVYVWHNRAINPVEGRYKEDKDAVQKKKSNESSGMKRKNREERIICAGPTSSTGGRGNYTVRSSIRSAGGNLAGPKTVETTMKLKYQVLKKNPRFEFLTKWFLCCILTRV